MQWRHENPVWKWYPDGLDPSVLLFLSRWWRCGIVHQRSWCRRSMAPRSTCGAAAASLLNFLTGELFSRAPLSLTSWGKSLSEYGLLSEKREIFFFFRGKAIKWLDKSCVFFKVRKSSSMKSNQTKNNQPPSPCPLPSQPKNPTHNNKQLDENRKHATDWQVMLSASSEVFFQLPSPSPHMPKSSQFSNTQAASTVTWCKRIRRVGPMKAK